MSLRRPPTRTPALLAANRANAQKSTGPRTPEGKNRVALSALRHGLNAPNFLSARAKSCSIFGGMLGRAPCRDERPFFAKNRVY